MLIRYGYDLKLRCAQPTPMIALLSIHPERRGDLLEGEQITFSPDLAARPYRDLYGNVCLRFTAPAGETAIHGEGTVRDSGEWDPVDPAAEEFAVPELPHDALIYLLGSRYCETDLLSQLAWDRFGPLSGGWNRVQAICNFVHDHIRFDYQAASATRTAAGAYEEGRGVCRDFTHLAIALCRALNIPARYVNGYLGDIGVPANPEPMDFNAWMEVYLKDRRGKGRWYSFDPRNNQPRIGRIVIARGRDAADVPLINSFGGHDLTGFEVVTEKVKEGAETREREQVWEG